MTETTFRPGTPLAPSRTLSANRTHIWRWLVTGIAGLTMVLFVAYFIMAINFYNRPFTGAFYSYTMTANASSAATYQEWPALYAGLEHLDWITGLNGQPLAEDPTDYLSARTTFYNLLSQMAIGDEITMQFQRNTAIRSVDPAICETPSNGFASCEISLTLRNLPNTDFLTFFLLPYLSGLIILAIGIAILYYRGNDATGLVAALFSFMTAIFVGGIFDLGAENLLTPVWIMAAVWAGGALFTLGLIFPKRMSILYRYPILQYLPIIITTLIGAALIARYLVPTSPWDNQAGQTGAVVSIVGLVSLIILQILYQRPRAVLVATRDQSNSVLIGTGLMLIPLTIWLLNRAMLLVGQPGNVAFEALMPLYIFPNATIAYAVLQYRRVDTDRIISSSLTYVIMLGALLFAIFLLTFGSSVVARNVIRVSDPLVIGVIIFFMVILFTPLRSRLQDRIDAIYFRSRRDFQEKVETFGRSITNASDYAAIAREFTRLITENIESDSIFVFLRDSSGEFVARKGLKDETDLRFAEDTPMIDLLAKSNEPITLQPDRPWPHEMWAERGRLQILRARILVPLMGAEQLNGFVVVGMPKAANKRYDYEEIRFVANLTGQFAIATERSQVINSLERRVQELDVLSQVSQAVSFTIDFDDLLELIYTQTSKLIEAPCFYIALTDVSSDHVYFAFFLEDDDRIESQENRHWPMGNDLFSEIIETGMPRRVADYRQELRTRGLTERPETDNLRSWMGVPLTAKSTTLGVLAAGKNTPGPEYTQEEFKILSDIGSLAAASIERTRLFSETQARERQLTVLNDISKQLVATEADVDKLLGLIMDSAVDILNAEAGSLLLTTQDTQNELEFYVVVGGAGDELVGTRIPFDRGIVGQVATNAEPIIVNNVADDPRHARDFDDETVLARSLLTVPLIAKNNVIGVLQVMNKRDGTIFVKADQDLMTTFAGQAAVAIENARLLQMQDIQLSDRVRELEVLERIDRELNRALDLTTVANLTVRSAMEELHAQAGALGIVSQSPPYLEIVAIAGYSEDEYPDGAQGKYWPLDEGIIARVMRTKSADFAPDVSIDPSYTKGLINSLSQITVPMMSGDDVNAILILETNALPRFTLPDWGFTQRLAEHASIAIANAQLYTALTEANKSKSTFMGFAAHELKNPLTPIKGYADALLAGMSGELSEQQQSMMQVVRNNVNRLETIIADLRDAAKIDANEFRVEVAPMDIRHAVIGALQPFIHILDGKNQELVNNVPEGLPLVMGDETRLIQVLTNLVSNAHKYSPDGTTITINARVLNDYRDARGTRIGQVMQVAVTDEGIGMSQEDVSRLFKEKYFRSTNMEALRETGTGLGMMLSYAIMEQHGGTIDVESEIGKGSTFSIIVPLAPESTLAPVEPDTEPASD
ncbi:GAF domain-containing protein [Phototrophicus methaneseepsis]|uniref:histidine kinase n=1 Tax=Phototrophicus methaneseepsis TaxID=2710758 RepID=A0A7S8ICT1_9CHLR|nr:GAF domain-containing protein [Phototrophicus methaneseepsis]QPC81870.1 GAF domain-containing protein [Phototrophicus methaneseepsis]